MKKQELEALELELLLDAIYRKYKYDFRGYSRASLKRRLLLRMAKNNLNSISEMIPLVLCDEKFFNQLLLDISVTVTEMFRDPSFFGNIREFVVSHLKTFPFIKVWHAGCATGEEVYSMAILLHEEGLLDRVHIYATDINMNALEVAKQGIYSLDKLHEYSKNYIASGGRANLTDYFQTKYRSCKVSSTIADQITFSYHNLASDSSFGEMQLIVCRNVLIYFDRPLQKRVLSLFSSSLDKFGILCLGSKESLSYAIDEQSFEPISKVNRIFKYKGSLTNDR